MSGSEAPGQHAGVGIVRFLSLSVLPHSRRDLPLYFDEVVHRVKGQFNVVPLQSHQVVMLKTKKKAMYMSNKETFNQTITFTKITL